MQMVSPKRNTISSPRSEVMSCTGAVVTVRFVLLFSNTCCLNYMISIPLLLSRLVLRVWHIELCICFENTWL